MFATFFFFTSGVFHSIYWGFGGFIGIVVGGGLIRLVGPTTAFRLFTMTAVLFIALFTMSLRYTNLRDRNYYSVLLSTFNICVDSSNTEHKCDDRSANAFTPENRSNLHGQSSASNSFPLEFTGNSWNSLFCLSNAAGIFLNKNKMRKYLLQILS